MVFTKLFYHLRDNGLDVSINEWLCLADALNRDLAHSSLLEFYYIARAILVKSEAEYDKFDLAFAAYFENIASAPQISDELLEYLSRPITQQEYDKDEVDSRTNLELDELRSLMETRLREQVGAHNGGKRWIGTGGTSPLGNSGYSYTGIRVGGEGERRSALETASARGYKDFREDETLNIRQYQTQFRRLRQMSMQQNAEKTELDINQTVYKTCDSGGHLKVVYRSPRKNALKLLLLFDSGGSMSPYAQMCNRLFQSVSKANHFAQLKIYYFHNCPYNRIYKTPECIYKESVDTQWLLNNISSDYKVIMVGDASMALWEMRYYTGGRESRPGDQISGLAWLSKFVKKCEHAVWFNPIPKELWASARGRDTIARIQQEIPMYHLSVKGLEQGIRYLTAGK